MKRTAHKYSEIIVVFLGALFGACLHGMHQHVGIYGQPAVYSEGGFADTVFRRGQDPFCGAVFDARDQFFGQADLCFNVDAQPAQAICADVGLVRQPQAPLLENRSGVEGAVGAMIDPAQQAIPGEPLVYPTQRRASLQDVAAEQKHVVEPAYATYKCFGCPKVFRWKSKFDIHVRTHTQDRPFVCTLCPQAFKEKGLLKRHMKTHLREERYVCFMPKCGRVFLSQAGLKEHVDTIHRQVRVGKQHVCPIPTCGKVFTRPSHLKSHILHRHLHEPSNSKSQEPH